jgi:hypothetical protein
MSRSSAPNQFNNDSVMPFVAIEALLDTGAVRVFNGIGQLTLNSKTFTGTRQILSISAAEETQEVKATGMQITFSGYTDGFIQAAMNEQYQNRTCNIYYGHFDKHASPQVVQSYLLYSGSIDTINILDSALGATFVMNVESRLGTLERVRSYRYTYQEQVQYHDDVSLWYLNDQQDKEIVWE